MEKYKYRKYERTSNNRYIIEELDKKRDVAISNKKQALLKDEVLKYGEEEDIIDYIHFIIYEGTGKLY